MADLSRLTKRIEATDAPGRVELDGDLRLSMAIGSASQTVRLAPDDARRLGVALIEHAGGSIGRAVRIVVASEAGIEA